MTKLLALCLLLAAACTVQRPPMSLTPTQKRAQILEDNIGWYHDSIPLLRFPTPFMYGALRLQVEQCFGLTRDGWPLLYVANQAPLPDHHAAVYIGGKGVIVFGLGMESSPWIIRHELGHWILEAHGIHGHPPEFYGPASPCRHLVQHG